MKTLGPIFWAFFFFSLVWLHQIKVEKRRNPIKIQVYLFLFQRKKLKICLPTSFPSSLTIIPHSLLVVPKACWMSPRASWSSVVPRAFQMSPRAFEVFPRAFEVFPRAFEVSPRALPCTPLDPLCSARPPPGLAYRPIMPELQSVKHRINQTNSQSSKQTNRQSNICWGQQLVRTQTISETQKLINRMACCTLVLAWASNQTSSCMHQAWNRLMVVKQAIEKPTNQSNSHKINHSQHLYNLTIYPAVNWSKHGQFVQIISIPKHQSSSSSSL